MSDQPDDQHNLEQHIPGLRQAVSNLSQTASASGFHLATIVITQPPPRDGAPAPPTRITFAHPIQQQPQQHQQMAATTQQPPERWISGPPPPQPHQWRPGESLPPLNPPPPIQTATTTTPTSTSPLPSPPSSRPKRASTSILETKDQSSPGGKRKRFSDPSEPLPGLTSAAFWGTVLEERPGAPTGMMPSQIAQPQQPLAPQPPIHSIIQPIPPQPQQYQPSQTPEHIHPSTQPQRQDDDRILRTATFPTLRLRSPTSNRQRNHVLPSFQEQLPTTAPTVYTEPQLSPVIPGSKQLRTQPGRSLLRRAAGQLLGRLSPFAVGPSLSKPSATRSNLPEEQLFQQRQLTTSAFPAVVPTPQRPAPAIFAAHPSREQHPFEIHQLAPLQAFQPPPPIGQHSGSRSASGSGVSHERPAHNTTSPPQVTAEGSHAPRSEPASRGRRGRKAGATGATPDREPQFFECELCDSKFKRKSDKNRHVRVVHEKSRPFMCPMCEKTFGEKSNMLKHRASVHDDVRTFRCPYCEQTFSQRGLCDTHVRTVHDKKQAKYFCEHCGLPFSRKVQLHEHYDTVHPEYMATYGRFQTGQQSGTQAMAAASRAGKQEAVRNRGGPAPTGQQLTAPEQPTQTAQVSLPIQPGEAGPSDPQQWVQYPSSSGPPASNELQPAHQQESKPSFPEENSGGNDA